MVKGEKWCSDCGHKFTPRKADSDLTVYCPECGSTCCVDVDSAHCCKHPEHDEWCGRPAVPDGAMCNECGTAYMSGF